MNAAVIRGWCPSLHEPMAAADGLLARVKPRVRGLSAADLRCIAEAAQTHGSGLIDLTNRGAFQVRGLDATGAMRFAETMVAAGLANADADGERRRNLQMGADCGPALLALAGRIEAWLETEAELGPLPSKFGFALADQETIDADILVLGEDTPWVILAGSALGVRTDAPEQAVQALVHAFLRLAPSLSPRPRRMKGLVEALGAEVLFARAGLRPQPAPIPPATRPAVGFARGGFGLGVALGAADADLLREAAALAERCGDGRLTLAPGRVLRLSGVAADALQGLASAAMRAGFIIQPGDPRLRLHACIGLKGCERTSADVRADALALAELAPAGGLHVSGCAKGCAHPQAAEITLVAETGGRSYTIIRDGAPGDIPSRRNQTLHQFRDQMSQPPASTPPHDYIHDGATIYERSFAIIRSEADLSRLTREQAQVTVRMIHACGMVELANDVRFSEGFIQAARGALLAGRPIFCDSEMVAHGITRARLPALNPVVCTLRDAATPALAERIGNTRSAAALDLWGERLAGAVVAIGNAPTALFHLLELLDAGAPRPAAVIGLPVGFVGAAESKAALAARADLPFLIVEGRKGGSAMAAAAVNALANETE